jgi:hypothetical protein
LAQAIICDLDEILIPPRKIKITEKTSGTVREIDVTDIPARVVLELIKRQNDIQNKIANEDEALFDWMLDLALKICKPSFPDITIDWVMENMDFEQLKRFLQFVLQPLNDYIEQAADEAKNTLAARTSQE